MRIEIKNLIHKYPSGDIALNGLNTIFEGIEPIAIIGQNGAGKTTFVKLLKGLLKPTQGDILLKDKSIKEMTVAQIAKHGGMVYQNPNDQICKNKVNDEVMFGPLNIGMPHEKAVKFSKDA